MKKKWICFVAMSLVLTMVFAQATEKQQKQELPTPTHADVSYGPDPMNTLDLWLVPSEKPTPLLVFIHGGGFRGGDKRKFSGDLIKNMHREGISVASINYRLTEKGLLAKGKNRYPAPMHDGARAVQFLRYHAEKYKLDKTRFAATGGSAGGCMLMWIGFHPDLAQAGHEDPVLRESTRLQVLAPRGGQTTAHGPTYLKWFGVESLNLSRKPGLVQPSSAREKPSEEDLALALDASPITHLTPDDPPIYLLYNGLNSPVDETTPWGTWVHHPLLGIKLKEAIDAYEGMECHLEYKDGPPVTAYESQQDFIIRKLKSLAAEEEAMNWKTSGFQQANSMGGGEGAISKNGKFRVFVLMGQSNMSGAAKASKLEPPYNEKHDRIRIWANGRWEYFVPSNRFGPGVSMAHQLAEHWPEDNIGIIKVAVGGTGICGFEKDWSFERAELTWDGKKGPLYKDLMNAVAEAKKISKPEFCDFVWKQGAADGTRKELAYAYYDRLRQLISDLRTDLDAPNLPVFVFPYMTDKALLKAVQTQLSEQELSEAKNSASQAPENDEELLKVLLSYLYKDDASKARKLTGKRPYIGTVIMAQNRVGREIPKVNAIIHGKLPVGDDGTHFNAEGQIKLGKITASAVEEFYKAKQ